MPISVECPRCGVWFTSDEGMITCPICGCYFYAYEDDEEDEEDEFRLTPLALDAAISERSIEQERDAAQVKLGR
jgi:uncharacterized Zn finger protein (UPF0148 family)